MSYTTAFNGIESIGDPHNLLGAILAETGVVGFVPFVLAQFFIFQLFNQLRKRGTPRAKLAWNYYGMIMLAFWIMNMDVTLAYYSELNVWFIFVLTMLYKYAAEERIVLVTQERAELALATCEVRS